MQTYNDIHQQFASFFKSESLKPLAYLVSKKLSEGHICIDLKDKDIQESELPPYYLDFEQAIKSLPNNKLVTQNPQAKQPFVLHQNRLYLQRYFNYESKILDRIKAFVASENETEENRVSELLEIKDFISSLFLNKPNVTNWQLVATLSSYINNFSIITGGPGTGKTTTVANILAILFHLNPDLKVGLAAPTGKASARMAESLKNAKLNVSESIKQKFQEIQPSTLHRLLGYIPDSPYFKHSAANTLNYDVIIVDESSMIDVALFSKLLDAVDRKTRIILLGDKNQLASVEAGSLFGDLCMAQPELNIFNTERQMFINSFITDASSQIRTEPQQSQHPLFQHIVELQFSHRFNSEEGIGKFSNAIISNNVQELNNFIKLNDDERVLIDTEFKPSVFEEFILGYEAYIKEIDIYEALKKFNQLRVLCAIREGEHGLYMTNKKIEQYLAKKNLLTLDKEFYENRPIIMNKNNYELGLFNGDIGIVRTDKNGVLKAHFEPSDGEERIFLPGLLAGAETVFAMTIHKSQGSEFEKVLIVLPESEGINILTRELLYTGVTRAKNKVVLQATTNSILDAANAQVKRASGISNRFLN
ncbi:exodeoxyribonuclease V subunit alpha [Pedobacter arcticus]|uniref:exodeoxyribonuclease V subunit alpha n=1 Tax=Pedobacter arcticus TaxID=752140 RepID=UPI0003027741|nr:exodeoxyribonuclease V subunit alpha [Pedobacter arcticus]